MKKATLAKDLHSAWQLLNQAEKRRGLGLLVGSMVTIGLDLASLAAILPVVLMVLQPDFWETAPLPEGLHRWILAQPLGALRLGILIGTVALFVVKNGLGYWVQQRRIAFYKDVTLRLSEQAFGHIIEGTTLQAFLERHGGESMQQLIFIPANFANNIVKGVFTLCTESLVLLAIVGVMLWYDPPIFVTAVIALTPGILLVILFRRRSTNQLGGKMKIIFNEYLQYVIESIRGYLDITLSGRKDTFMARFQARSQRFHRTQQQILLMNTTTPRLVETAAILGIVGILGYLAFSEATALKATVTLGIFTAGAYKLIPSLTSMITAYTQLNAFRFTVHELQYLLPETTEEEAIPFEESVALQKVSFHYHAQAFGLKDLSICLSKGQKVALVGPSGSGKTTLIHLLLGLFTPQAGHLVVDGRPLSPAQVRGWRQHISYVPQHPLILEGSLAENIAFGIPETDIDWPLLERVVQEAELEPLIAQMPQGLHTPVGAEGRMISGGQRQRVALARALYQQRPVLILDEVTANLDEATEAAVLETLVKLSHSARTLLFISHRPQILEHCDTTWTLDQGEIRVNASSQETANLS